MSTYIKNLVGRDLVCLGIILLSSCSENKYLNEVIREEYFRNEKYGTAIISIRDKNTFTRKDCITLLCKEYYGTLQQAGDTLILKYEGGNQPDELNYMVRKENVLMVLPIYEVIKSEYSQLSREELDKISHKELMTKDTTAVEYQRIK